MVEKYRIIEIRSLSTTVYYQYTDNGALGRWKDLKEETENQTKENYLIAASLDEYNEEVGIFVQKEHILFKVGILKVPNLDVPRETINKKELRNHQKITKWRQKIKK